MSLIADAMRGASRVFSQPATLKTFDSYTIDPDSGAHVPTGTPKDMEAHWTDYGEAMKRAGMTEHPRFAHMVDNGITPKPDDILTINGEGLIIKQVRRSSVGAVWFLGGDRDGTD